MNRQLQHIACAIRQNQQWVKELHNDNSKLLAEMHALSTKLFFTANDKSDIPAEQDPANFYNDEADEEHRHRANAEGVQKLEEVMD